LNGYGYVKSNETVLQPKLNKLQQCSLTETKNTLILTACRLLYVVVLSLEGYRVVQLDDVISIADIIVTCTGRILLLHTFKLTALNANTVDQQMMSFQQSLRTSAMIITCCVSNRRRTDRKSGQRRDDLMDAERSSCSGTP
jgi:S-adenosyl-L-homocysteine hydrolase, NAD binding domain